MQNCKASEGKAQAETIISKFYRVRPEDGMIEEKDHYLEGCIIARKVLLFPSAKVAPSPSRMVCTISTVSITCPPR